jgi:hypothetical protein
MASGVDRRERLERLEKDEVACKEYGLREKRQATHTECEELSSV